LKDAIWRSKYRWAEGHFDELDALARELVTDGVALIAATGGTRSAQAAKNATPTIPIVFVLGADPVKLGFATTFNNPGGNITGLTIFTTELATKRLSLLYDLDPGIRNAAILVNPQAPTADVEIDSQRLAWNTPETKRAGRQAIIPCFIPSRSFQCLIRNFVSEQVFFVRYDVLVRQEPVHFLLPNFLDW
jgi:ABC transporter substrate binding protein